MHRMTETELDCLARLVDAATDYADDHYHYEGPVTYVADYLDELLEDQLALGFK